MSTPSIPHRVLITGTGRAGTTFLVQLLTDLGLHTGYTPESWTRDYFEHCSAGLEKSVEDPEAPYIVKNPNACDDLGGIVSRGRVVLDHVIVPIRSLEDAARSRARVGGTGDVPGGLVGTNDPAAQAAVLATRFHAMVHALVVHQLPHTFLEFPRFAHDPHYAFTQLQPILDGIGWDQFERAFKRIARPDLIHDFSTRAPVTPAPDSGAGRFRRQQRRQRWLRRARRITLWGATLTAFAFVARTNGHDPLTPESVDAPASSPAHEIDASAINQSLREAERSFSRTRLFFRPVTGQLLNTVRVANTPPPPKPATTTFDNRPILSHDAR